jgi:hypothetical protein
MAPPHRVLVVDGGFAGRQATIGFENRFVVLTRWAFNFFVRSRGARLIARRSR